MLPHAISPIGASRSPVMLTAPCHRVSGSSFVTFVLAVRPVANHPQLISTSRHITQGIVDVLDETADVDHVVFTGAAATVVEPDCCESPT